MKMDEETFKVYDEVLRATQEMLQELGTKHNLSKPLQKMFEQAHEAVFVAHVELDQELHPVDPNPWGDLADLAGELDH
jgi:hypothetical protein